MNDAVYLASKQNLWNRNFIILTVSNLLLFLIFEMFMPILPIAISNNGGSDAEVGLIMGSFTFSAIISRLFVGEVSRRLNRKTLLIFSVVGSMLATGLYYWGTSCSSALIIRLLHGLAFGVATTLYTTVTAAFIPSNRQGEGLGYFGAGETIGISFGPFLGLWLMNGYGFGGACGIGALILLIAALFTLKVDRPPVTRDEKKLFSSEKALQNSTLNKFIEKRVFLPSILAFLLGMSLAGIMSFIVLYAREKAIPDVAYFFFVNAMASLFSRFFAGKLFDRKGPGIIIGASTLLCATGTYLIATASGTTALIIAAIFYGTGIGAAFPALQAWCITLVPVSRHEHAIGTFFNSFDLGIGTGSILLGIVVTVTSYKTMYLASITLFILYWIIYQCSVRKTNNPTVSADCDEEDSIG